MVVSFKAKVNGKQIKSLSLERQRRPGVVHLRAIDLAELPDRRVRGIPSLKIISRGIESKFTPPNPQVDSPIGIRVVVLGGPDLRHNGKHIAISQFLLSGFEAADPTP
jgi:hypothetical protein